MKERLPNLFIVGAAKSGTSSMYQYLRVHKDIYGPNNKEPRFLSKDDFSYLSIKDREMERIIKTKQEYAQLYKEATNERYVLDGSVYTMVFENAVKKIKEIAPFYKVIVMLRNPVDRFISHYKMAYLLGQINMSIEQFVKTPICGMGLNSLELGLYYNQVKRLYDILGKDNVKVIIFDDLKEDMQKVLVSIYKFLDIDNTTSKPDKNIYFKNPGVSRMRILHNIYMNNKVIKAIKKVFINTKIRNIKKYIHKIIYKELKVPSSVYDYLYQYYIDDIIKLENLLNVNLDRWKRNYE